MASIGSAAAAVAATLSIRGAAVPVTAAAGIDRLAAVLASPPFVDWAARLDPALRVASIHVQSVDWFGARVGFVKFAADVSFGGRRVPGIVFARGGAVSVLPILRCGGERFVVCCRQPRVAVGSADFLELPAGMLDGSGAFAGVAAKEMQEETGLEMRDEELLDLTALAFGDGVRGMYPSVGACDEFLRLFLFERSVGAAELAALRGKATGNLEEGEVITLELVPYDELWRRAPDAKTLCALHLYEKLGAAGLLPAAAGGTPA